MADIPKHSQRRPINKNPITTDPALSKLLADAKTINTEEKFKGWKDSFLKVYRTYLDPSGVENAHLSHSRLLRSMEKLAETVVGVQELVNDGKISAEAQSVMGKRALTNMTDQMAKTEQEISRFMPATGADEEEVGYNKFELGAVMIEGQSSLFRSLVVFLRLVPILIIVEYNVFHFLLVHLGLDGFHVYELLKTTKDIIMNLLEKVLDDVLQTHQKSIIQFYLRQIQSFNDVMADLGLFGLMQDVMEMYKVIPRNKKGNLPNDFPTPRATILAHCNDSDSPPAEGPEIIELDPDKKYNFRAQFTDGYVDPFSGTTPGTEQNSKDQKDNNQGVGGGDDFIVYFDLKTGCIGKIERSKCAAKSLIVAQDDDGAEVMQGEIDDDDEMEKLIWDMKKAIKAKNGGGRATSKSPGTNRKKYVITPRKDAAGRKIGRSKSGDSALKSMQAPSLDKENEESLQSPEKARARRLSLTKRPPSTTQPPKRLSKDLTLNGPSRKASEQKESSESAASRKLSAQEAGTPKRPSIHKAAKDPKPSSDGWSNATSMTARPKK